MSELAAQLVELRMLGYPKRDTVNGIRFIACGYADLAWDEEEGWVSINSDYVRDGDRARVGIRWEGCKARPKDWELIKEHEEWLKGKDK